jgi:hypothetical protein
MWVRLSLRMWVRLSLRLRLRVWLWVWRLWMLRLMLGLSLWLVLRLSLMLPLRLRMHRLHFRPGSDAGKPAMLQLHKRSHGLKLGFQLLGPAFVLPLQLFDQLFELCLRCIDLLLKQIGSIL